jgi:hypothetical protein
MTTDRAAFRADPTFFQNIFEDVYGIPTAGRSPYQTWLANQWRTPAAGYALSQAGVQGGLPAVQGRTFEEYLQARRTPTATAPSGIPIGLGGGYLQSLTAMEPQAQRALLETLPDYVQTQALLGGFQSQYPRFMAGPMTAQAIAPELGRQFEISPAAIEGQTFLNFLRNRYGIGTPTGVGGGGPASVQNDPFIPWQFRTNQPTVMTNNMVPAVIS